MVKLRRQKVSLRKKIRLAPREGKSSLKNAARFLIVILILGVIAALFVRVKYMFVDSDYFLIKAIDSRIYDESRSLRNIALSGIDKLKINNENIFLVDLNEFEEKIEGLHPELKDVVVRRMLPNKLVVEGRLRKAIAQIRSDRYYPIDIEGVALPDIKNFPDPLLPVIAGMGVDLARAQKSGFSSFERDKLNKALTLIKEKESVKGLLALKLRFIDVTDPGNMTFHFEGSDVEIKIGNSDFHNRLLLLFSVLEQIGADLDKFKYIDLRFEDPIIGPR